VEVFENTPQDEPTEAVSEEKAVSE